MSDSSGPRVASRSPGARTSDAGGGEHHPQSYRFVIFEGPSEQTVPTPLGGYWTESRVISNTSVALGGIGPLRIEPYASEGGITSRRTPPTFIPGTP